MKHLFFIPFLFFSIHLSAQTDSLYATTNVDYQIYVFEFKACKKKLLDFIEKRQAIVLRQRESKKDLSLSVAFNQEDYLACDSLLSTFGYFSSKNLRMESKQKKYNELSLEIKYLKEKQQSYEELLNKVGETSENYLNLWNEQKRIEEKIFDKEKELISINVKQNTFIVAVDLNDETTSPEYTEVSFVNMPGVEYSYLFIESPMENFSPEYYQGYFIKYLFTRGKSFGTIGVYKNKEIASSDSLTFSEMFLLGFGQDFYSRHLGRGGRKFLNVYSGYSLGGILATGIASKQYLCYISPTIGIELFKNKYMLLDSKANYFVPVGNYKHLRGFSCNVSLNFVF